MKTWLATRDERRARSVRTSLDKPLAPRSFQDGTFVKRELKAVQVGTKPAGQYSLLTDALRKNASAAGAARPSPSKPRSLLTEAIHRTSRQQQGAAS